MKKIFRMALVCALAGATLLYTGCTKDYSDDINDLKDRVSTVETTVSQLQAAINAGSVITNVTANTDGYLVTLSNGESYQVYNGKAGADGKDGKDGVDGNDGKDGAAGENGKDGKDGSVVTIGENGNWFIDDKDTGVKAEATVSEITINEDGYICIDGKATDVKAGTVAVWDATKGTVTFKGINADGSDLVIGVCELESIVFIPQVYMEGIEGAKYNYIEGYYYTDSLSTLSQSAQTALNKNWDALTATYDDESQDVVAQPVKGFNHFGFAVKQYKDYNDEYQDWPYCVGETAEAEYHVNPNSFDLSKATFTLEGMDVETMTRAGQTYWTPVLKSIARNEDKNAVVTYQIQFPEYATGTEPDEREHGKMKKDDWGYFYYDSDVAVMRLRGTLKDSGKSVDSDYEAIVPFRNELHHLAFTSTSSYTTNAWDYIYEGKEEAKYSYPKCKYACGITPSTLIDKELYITSMQAMQEAPSVDVQYQESLDIADILDVHYHPASANKVHETIYEDEATMTLGQFLAEYPQFKATYTLIGYKLGDNKSREDMYGQLDGSVFYPCHVDDDGTTQYRNDASKGETDGISSVGRKPIVLVTVEDETGVVLFGYFKIKICKDVLSKADFVIKDLGKFPYICNGQLSTTWSECSHSVLEKGLKMTYDQFKTRYVKGEPVADTDAAYEAGEVSPNYRTYIKNEKGEFVDVTPDTKTSKDNGVAPAKNVYDAKTKTYVTGKNYGSFVYTQDKKSGGVNDKFSIVIDEIQQLDNIKKDFGGTVTLYTKFGTSADYVYMGLTITVAPAAQATFIEHLANYWYTPTDQSTDNTVIVNPRIPTDAYEDDKWGTDRAAGPISLTEPAFKRLSATSSITGYGLNLEKAWVGNRVKVNLSDSMDAEVKALYSSIWGKDAPISYHYEFAAEQTCQPNGGYLYAIPYPVNEGINVDLNEQEALVWSSKAVDFSKCYAYADYVKALTDAKVDVNIIAVLSTENVRTYTEGVDKIGTRTTADGGKFKNVDLIWYYHDGTKNSSKAKEILNEYTHPEKSTTGALMEKLSDMLYADVDLVATYGNGENNCDIPCGSETFHVAFFRPIDILNSKTDGLKDGKAGGDWINLGDLYTAKDWQGREVFYRDTTKNAPQAYKANVEKFSNGDLNWYTFYGFESLEVNINEVKTDQAHHSAPEYVFTHKSGNETIEGVNPNLILHIANVSDVKKAVDNTDGKYVLNVASTDALDDYVLYYENGSHVSQDYHLYVPVSIKYWWGVVTAEIEVPVTATIAE